MADRLMMARGMVDLPVALVDDLSVDLVDGQVPAWNPLIPHYSGDRGVSVFQRSLRHIEVGT